ncbi:MAG: Uma2 family endonuclease [Thermodesulfobacteriota bacterium]
MHPSIPSAGDLTVERYFALARAGAFEPDERVELLEGVVVPMAPQNPPHSAGVTAVDYAVRAVVGDRAVVRVQQPLIAGVRSVPEPDLALVEPPRARYESAHPETALLVVEVAQHSLASDRLVKARLYASAAIPEYWIVRPEDACVEVLRSPDVGAKCYREHAVVRRGDRIVLVSFPDATVAVSDLLPGEPPDDAL